MFTHIRIGHAYIHIFSIFHCKHLVFHLAHQHGAITIFIVSMLAVEFCRLLCAHFCVCTISCVCVVPNSVERKARSTEENDARCSSRSCATGHIQPSEVSS